MKKVPVIHPFLFALFPILALYTYNARVIPITFGEVVLPAGLALASSVIIYFLLRLLLKSPPKAGFLTSLILIWFFSYGHITANLRLWGLWILDVPFFLGTLSLILMAFIAVIRSKKSYAPLTSLLNIVAAALVIYNLVIGAQILARTTRINTDTPLETVSRPAHFPNIYYILLDGYGRADILSEIYGFDNSAFVKHLEQKGFYVASQSNANYCQTYLSLAAALNLGYLDDLAARMGPRSTDRGPLIQMIRESRVRHLLKSQGYSFITFASGYAGTEIRDADLYVHFKRSLSEFQNVLFNTTLLPIFAKWSLDFSLYDIHRNRILSTFRALSSFRYEKSPYFVFAHILAPHPPFVFGKNGETITPPYAYSIKDGSHLHGINEAEIQGYIRGYKDQLSFINQKVIETVDNLLATSPDPPVIILQSDHGPKAFTDWDRADATYMREPMAVFNAVFLPGEDYYDFYPGISPVNTFIALINHIMGTTKPFLEDKSSFSTWERPYDFIRYDPATYSMSVKSIQEIQKRVRLETRHIKR